MPLFRLVRRLPRKWRSAIARRLPPVVYDTYVFLRDRGTHSTGYSAKLPPAGVPSDKPQPAGVPSDKPQPAGVPSDKPQPAGVPIDNIDLKLAAGYDLVVICPNYPSESGPRNNGGEFIRTRVAAYCRRHLNVLVIEVSSRNARRTLETQRGHLCVRLHPNHLDQLLGVAAQSCPAFFVHVVTPPIYDAIRRRVPAERVAYFFHGAEIRDYRRLYFNFSTAEMEQFRQARDATHATRMDIARRLIQEGRSHLVFVSHFLKSIAQRDTGLPIPQALVIPNFIDGGFYRYQPKTAIQARRVLIIRSFAAANYASDIAVGAILKLLQSPEGAQFHFTVCGFGRYFFPLTLPLTTYGNVTVREGVLSREEMRVLHEHHGIFLAPSRYDTQGVTMCEAMASGLVPVTHGIGGIPEFVDADCGVLARDHTPDEFALCILALTRDVDEFQRKSRRAAERVRERCGVLATIDRELAVIAEPMGNLRHRGMPRVVRMEDVPTYVNPAYPRVATLTRGPNGFLLRYDGTCFAVDAPPLSTCRYAYPDGKKAGPWLAAARAIGARVAPKSVLLIRAGDPLLPLALMLKKHCGIDYVIWDLTPECIVGTPAIAVLSSALAVVLAPNVAPEAIATKYVGPLRAIPPDLPPQLLLELATGPAIAPLLTKTPEETNQLKKRILLVAYYAGECNSVGALRPNYWFEELDRVSGGRTETHLVTAIRPAAASTRVHYVPDLNGITLTDEEDLEAPWVSEFISTETARAKNFNTLGYFWRIELERYFSSLDLRFDAVIISGNPFAYFDFSAFAKSQWGAQVVLDYRDPFALNPRFKYSPGARVSACAAEAGYNFQADLILTVTRECAELVVGYEEHRTAVVPNGFDERIAASVTPTTLTGDRINFVHAGSFSHDRRVEELLAALQPSLHCLHHIGRAPDLPPEITSHGRLRLHGLQPYPTTLSIVAGADCGIVFLTASGFESTTKIFDYLCFDLDVLVLSPDDNPRGALAEFGALGAKLHWVKNTTEAIQKFLQGYKPSQRRPGFGARYSRRAATRYLLEQIGIETEVDN